MPITFEEKSGFGKNIIGAIAALAIIAATGFLAWNLINREDTEKTTPQSQSEIKINKKILNDSRLAVLELFPAIPPATISEIRGNPFMEYEATTTEDSLM